MPLPRSLTSSRQSGDESVRLQPPSLPYNRGEDYDKRQRCEGDGNLGGNDGNLGG